MEVREASASYSGLTELPGGVVPLGYRQTEAGVIPEDWELISLLSLAGDSKGRFDDGDWIEAEFLTPAGIRLIQTGNLGIGRFIDKETKKYISVASFERLRCKDVFEGDLLVCRLAEPAGRACIVPALEDMRAITAVDVTIFRPIPAIADKRFLLQYFCTNQWLFAVSERCGGSTRSRIARGALGQIDVPIPRSLVEQEAIAEALSDADALIESLQQLIAKKRQIKQGTKQALLTGKQRLPEFSGKWAKTKIGDLLTIMHGKNQHAVEDENGSYPILATGGQIGSASSFLYDKPSVLIGRKGTIDRPQFMDTPFWSVDTLFYSVIHQPNVAKYVFYRFCLIDWKSHNEASGVPSLNARTIEQIELNVPLSNEQTAIAIILTDMDTELAELETRLAKTRQLKQGMMQALLTGRIRLV